MQWLVVYPSCEVPQRSPSGPWRTQQHRPFKWLLKICGFGSFFINETCDTINMISLGSAIEAELDSAKSYKITRVAAA